MSSSIAPEIWSELRLISGLSTKMICDHTQMSRQHLFNIEKGRSLPGDKTKEKLLELYITHLTAQKGMYEDKLSRINFIIHAISEK